MSILASAKGKQQILPSLKERPGCCLWWSSEAVSVFQHQSFSINYLLKQVRLLFVTFFPSYTCEIWCIQTSHSGSWSLGIRTFLLFKVYFSVLFVMQERRQSFLEVTACTLFRLLPHGYMIAVVQLDVFPTIITSFRNNRRKKMVCPLFLFFFSFWFLALELREKIPPPRTWVDEIPCWNLTHTLRILSRL